jgi:hypothetical protein
MARRYRREVDARQGQLVVGAAAAAVLVAIVAFAAATGVKDEGPRPTPTPSPPPSERELFGGSLEPGVRYRTRAFVPAMSFSVGDTEWLARGTTSADYLNLEREISTGKPGGDYPARSWLVFSRLPLVYDRRGARLRPAPVDLYGWMRRHPDLEVGPRRSVTVADVPGVAFSVHVRLRRHAVSAPECIVLTVHCTAIAPNRLLPYGARIRTTVLAAADTEPLVIDLIGLERRDLRRLERPAAAVLRSLRIGVTAP